MWHVLVFYILWLTCSVNFKIVSDTTTISHDGFHHHWNYKVHYTEKLTHWPWTADMEADYMVKTPLPHSSGPPVFHIESVQRACFAKGFYCCMYEHKLLKQFKFKFFIFWTVRAESVSKFHGVGDDTYCLEKIQYQCPPFLGRICRRELDNQRKAVMHNLTMIFGKKANGNV